MKKTNLIVLSIINGIHFLLIFLPLLVEQIKTGWGYPTNLEMGVLILWLFEFILCIYFLGSIAYFFYRWIKTHWSKEIFLSLSLILIFIVQLILTNIFISM